MVYGPQKPRYSGRIENGVLYFVGLRKAHGLE